MRSVGKGKPPPPAKAELAAAPRGNARKDVRGVMEAAARARRDVRGRVDEVNAVTEREVLGAARSVSSIIERTSVTIGRLKELASRFDGGGGSGCDSVGQAISAQTHTVRSFVSELVELAQAQAEATLAAQRSMIELDRATRAIDSLASEAKILA